MKKESYTTIPAEKELYITLTMKDALPATVAMHNHIKKHCRAMAKDFSWGNSAKQYEEMYNWLIGDK